MYTMSWSGSQHALHGLSHTVRHQAVHRATPHRRKPTPPILTRHLYHHTPLIEYIQKHLYMYPRTLLFGSWDITNPYHRPYAHIYMHMHSYGYTCVHMHADARPLPHPRLTLHAYACRCVHMHTHWGPTPCIPSICMHEREDGCIPVHVHACACRWMTASIILFVIHRCMGCTRWRFTGYLQRVACLFRCTVVPPSQWFGPLWVMIWSVMKSR